MRLDHGIIATGREENTFSPRTYGLFYRPIIKMLSNVSPTLQIQIGEKGLKI